VQPQPPPLMAPSVRAGTPASTVGALTVPKKRKRADTHNKC
jgi:hypothetical protein